MNEQLIGDLIALGVPDFIDQAHTAALLRSVTTQDVNATRQASPVKLARYAFIYERQGVLNYRNWISSGLGWEAVKGHFRAAYHSWHALASLGLAANASSSVSSLGLAIVEEELAGEPLPSNLLLAFRLAVSGTLAERPAEARLELKRFDLTGPTDDSWRAQVIHHVFASLVRLIRKADGWEDIDSALSGMGSLRQLQADYEGQYVEGQGPKPAQIRAALELVGLYHLAQTVTTTGEYLKHGLTSHTEALQQLDKHWERATEAFHSCNQPYLAQLGDLVWIGCREAVRNSIWSHIVGLGEKAESFARLLAASRTQPVLELWPSQQEAFRKNFNDIYRRAIMVQMPTSAGKTLLAKFAIVQTKAFNPNGRIAYVVPTRALVNQVTMDLRSDFGQLEPPLRVEQAVPAFELDPAENQLLAGQIDILVTTPEKLDLLIRKDHVSTHNLALVVADEAHNLGDQNRGPRLELLLGTIKRERKGVRFLLLSPFLPNGDDLVRWLGDDRYLPPITVDWKPSARVVGALDVRGRGRNRALVFETLNAVDNSDTPPGLVIPLGPPVSKGLKHVTKAATKAFRAHNRGATLVLCEGPGTSMTRANQLAEDMPMAKESELVEAVCRYLEAESGPSTPLIPLLKKQVAYHHAGLSHETRWLIETLIKRNHVKVVCGTTTLAQGVNFPIGSVIVESLAKGDAELTYEDFWNIAGRAGRALMDTVGIVAFPILDRERDDEIKEFLRGEAQDLSSRLASLIERVDEIGDKFDIPTVRKIPELSALLQFLAHAMRVSRAGDVADQVEDILRASLVYQQHKGNDANRKRLIQLCRQYLTGIKGNRGILELADHTGFATPSVFALLRKKQENPHLSRIDGWSPQRLFGANLLPLTQRIEAIKDLPEIQLGRGKGQPFEPEAVAAILRDWVNGARLDEMAQRYPIDPGATGPRAVADFSRYLFSRLLVKASWALGALEGVTLSGQDFEASEVAYIPSMVFFGVNKQEAVWMRMAGIPRLVADGLGSLWREKNQQQPTTYDEVRSWVSSLDETGWRRAIPRQSPLLPRHAALVWKILNGQV